MCIAPAFDFLYGGKPFSALNWQVEKTDTYTRYSLEDGFYVELHQTVYPHYDALEWLLYFGNAGKRDSALLENIRDCCVDLPVTPDPPCFAGAYPPPEYARISAATGNTGYQTSEEAAEEFAFYDYPLREGQVFSRKPIGGRSSSYAYPFFEINHGETGYLLAIGWSGQWQASFTRGKGWVRAQTGLEYAKFILHPGERVRTTSTLLVSYRHGRENAYNTFRRLVKEHMSPLGKNGVPEQPPMSFECFGGMPSDCMKERIAALGKHGVQFEYLWIDAGWYGDSTEPCSNPYTGDWGGYTGDWYVNRHVHPKGMQDVREAAAKNGMKMLVWFEPERAMKTSRLYKEHPEWFIAPPNTGNTVLTNLADDTVMEGMLSLLSEQIAELGIACYRQDFNIDPLGFWLYQDTENRQGITEIRHITNLYRMWDALLARFPGLIIDNCASGGRRIDLETLKRSVPIWRTDYYCNLHADPNIYQVQNFGVQRFVPYSGGVTKRIGDTYTARSSYASAWVGAYWCYDFLHATEEELEWARQISEEYLALRPYFSCDFYALEKPGAGNTGWCAWQYDRPEQADGVLFVFRRENACCTDAVYQPHLVSGKSYRFRDIDSGETFLLPAERLTNDLPLSMPMRRSAKILTYQAID